jgi:hypothetical protein
MYQSLGIFRRMDANFSIYKYKQEFAYPGWITPLVKMPQPQQLGNTQMLVLTHVV